MFTRIRELSVKNKGYYYLFFPLLWLTTRLGISRPIVDEQFIIKNFQSFYNHAFQHVKGGSLVLSISDYLGDFSIDVRSDIAKWLMKFGNYEPDLALLVKEHIKPDRDVIDVGANIGLFSILSAKLVSGGRKVLSIEPTPRALELLRKNVSENDCTGKVVIFKGIATAKPGSYMINQIAGKEEYSSLGQLVHTSTIGYISQKIEVRGDTLDNLVNLHQIKPGFIKIDAEGAEHLILQGAEETLNKYQPTLLLEISEKLLTSCGSTSEMVINLLTMAGYKLTDAKRPGDPIQPPFDGTLLAVHPVAL